MTETYIIAITPPAHIQTRVLKERREYQNSSEYHLPPHITLYHPFTSNETVETLAKQLKKALSGIAPQPICLDAYGIFENKHIVLFFKPNSASTAFLTTLHAKTKRVIPKDHTELHTTYQTHGGYHPHLTIAEHISKRELVKLKSKLKTLPKPLVFRCSRVDIYQRNQKSRDYSKVRHVRLQP